MQKCSVRPVPKYFLKELSRQCSLAPSAYTFSAVIVSSLADTMPTPINIDEWKEEFKDILVPNLGTAEKFIVLTSVDIHYMHEEHRSEYVVAGQLLDFDHAKMKFVTDRNSLATKTKKLPKKKPVELIRRNAPWKF